MSVWWNFLPGIHSHINNTKKNNYKNKIKDEKGNGLKNVFIF